MAGITPVDSRAHIHRPFAHRTAIAVCASHAATTPHGPPGDSSRCTEPCLAPTRASSTVSESWAKSCPLFVPNFEVGQSGCAVTPPQHRRTPGFPRGCDPPRGSPKRTQSRLATMCRPFLPSGHPPLCMILSFIHSFIWARLGLGQNFVHPPPKFRSLISRPRHPNFSKISKEIYSN